MHKLSRNIFHQDIDESSHLESVDEDSPLVKNSSLIQSIIKHRELAEKHDLIELHKLISELVPALAGSSQRHLNVSRNLYSCLTGSLNAGDGMSKSQLERNFQIICRSLDCAFDKCDAIPEAIKACIAILGPKGNFDFMHVMFAMQGNLMGGMATQNQKEDALMMERNFEKGDPIQKEQREKEVGYKHACREAKSCTDAEHANQCGKEAFRKQKIWTAEVYWERAIELDSSKATYYSNLSCLQIKIGRYLRSLEIGYRGLATKYLQKAISTAERGIIVDPKWERSYQRGAEAHFALNTHANAMDAMKLLKKAQDNLDDPSSAIKKLQVMARHNATEWFKLKLITPTVPKTINAAIDHLRVIIAKCCRLCYSRVHTTPPSENDIQKAGDDVADALALVLAALQLIYTKRSDWERESKALNQSTTDFQIELRQLAKVLPLETLVHSKNLRNVVFVEAPHTLWGMDCLDRLNTDFLNFTADDPCDASEGNEVFDELFARHTGERGVGVEAIHHTAELIGGKGAKSTDPDMAIHHLCAFTISVLDRIVASDKYPELAMQVSERLILFNSTRLGLVKGGEFIGKATKTAMGLDAFKAKGDSSKFFRFIETKGGLSAVTREAMYSSDPGQWIQKLISLISPTEWTRKNLGDVLCVLSEYGFGTIDGDNVGLELVECKDYVIQIVGNILEGLWNALNDDDVNLVNKTAIFLGGVIRKSPFGNYMMMNFPPDQQSTSCMREVLRISTEKWEKLSAKKKAAYRWEAMSDKQKNNMSHFKPLSRVEKFEKKLSGEKISKVDVLQAPSCDTCRKHPTNLLKCPCKLVYYCSKECQVQGWSEHKAIHKKAMETMMK